MKARQPIARSQVPLKRTRLKRSRKPIPQMSARRLSEAERRAEVVAFVHQRDRTCQAISHGLTGIGCSGPLDVHEIVPRSAWARGYLEPTNCLLVCRAHHRWIGSHIHAAHALGLHSFSWERPR